MKTYYLRIVGEAFEAAIDDAPGGLRVTVTRAGGASGPARRADLAEIVPGYYSLLLDGRSHTIIAANWRGGAPGPRDGATGDGVREVHLLLDGVAVAAETGRSSRTRGGAHVAVGSVGLVRAPMPGLVVAIHAQPGAEVAAGQPLVIMEAMKMQMEIRAPHAGVVREVHVAPGRDVAGNDLLVTVE
ncbi:MAG TPA: biotin/lipoyl-containing protein [bacterium]|nr:biotin/lipoyl-containing protein [bacterium]